MRNNINFYFINNLNLIFIADLYNKEHFHEKIFNNVELSSSLSKLFINEYFKLAILVFCQQLFVEINEQIRREFFVYIKLDIESEFL